MKACDIRKVLVMFSMTILVSGKLFASDVTVDGNVAISTNLTVGGMITATGNIKAVTAVLSPAYANILVNAGLLIDTPGSNVYGFVLGVEKFRATSTGFVISNNLTVGGSVTASNYIGNGSGLTGITPSQIGALPVNGKAARAYLADWATYLYDNENAVGNGNQLNGNLGTAALMDWTAFASAAQGAKADAALPVSQTNQFAPVSEPLAFLLDGSRTGGRSAWGNGVSTTNMDSASYGAVQNGTIQSGASWTITASPGAQQRGLGVSTSKLSIGNMSYGAYQFLACANGATGTLATGCVGAGQIGGVMKNSTIDSSAQGSLQRGQLANAYIGPSAYAATILQASPAVSASYGAMTNLAKAAVQIACITTGQVAYTTTDGAASLMLGAGYSSNKNAIVVGDGQVTHGDGSITAGGGFYGNGSNITGITATQVGSVGSNDARLSDARIPLAHTQAVSTITGLGSAAFSNANAFATAAQGARADAAVMVNTNGVLIGSSTNFYVVNPPPVVADDLEWKSNAFDGVTRALIGSVTGIISGIEVDDSGSTNAGINWSVVGPTENWGVMGMSGNGNVLAASVLDGSFRVSLDAGSNWVPRGTTQNWSSISVSYDGKYMAAGVEGGKIWTSDDFGTNWVENSTTIAASWYDVAVSSNGQYQTAVARLGNIWTSSDYGASWATNASAGSEPWRCVGMSADGRFQVAGDYPHGGMMSTNYGATWAYVAGGTCWNSVAISDDGRCIVAAADMLDAGVWVSTNSGVTWVNRLGVFLECASISADGRIMAATHAGVNSRLWLSYDYGVTWSIKLTDYGLWSPCIADKGNFMAVLTIDQVKLSKAIIAPGLGNIALGYGAVVQKGGLNADFINTVEIGQGVAVSNGFFHYQGYPYLDGLGGVYGNGSHLSGITAAQVGALPVGSVFAASSITNLGTAAYSNASAFATAAQGANADATLTNMLFFHLTESEVALGENSDGSSVGIALGPNADGHYIGIALGPYANGSLYGVAVGSSSLGFNNGVAVGMDSQGSDYGVAIGRHARASGYGNIAIET